MKTVPRLDVMAMKTIKGIMKKDPEFASLVQENHPIKSIIETIQTTHKQCLLEQKQGELNFLLLRFIHLRLIVCLLSLFEIEPDAFVELNSRRHSSLEITTPWYDDRRVFVINDETFWNKTDFVRHLIRLFLTRFPRSISVYRSPVDMVDAPIHTFVHAIQDNFQTPSEKKWARVYNQQYLQEFA